LESVVHKMNVSQQSAQKRSQIPFEFHTCLFDKPATFGILRQQRDSKNNTA